MSGNMAKFFPLVCTALLALFGSSKACRDLRSNDGVLGGLSDGRAKWISLRDSWGLTGTYQYRLYKTCKNKPTFPDCFLGDNGPFYITVTDGTVSEALSLFSNEKLDTSKFKTIEETFDELEDLLRGGAEVHPAWRFDDIQGVPDELIVFKYGEGKELLNEYNYRIVVRMPKEFHMQRLGAAKAAFGAKDIENYSFIFQRLCVDCEPPKKMVVKDGKGVDGGMTMYDVYDLIEKVILSEPIFLDITYTSDGLPIFMDVDLENEVVVGDTKDTIRISEFTPA